MKKTTGMVEPTLPDKPFLMMDEELNLFLYLFGSRKRSLKKLLAINEVNLQELLCRHSVEYAEVGLNKVMLEESVAHLDLKIDELKMKRKRVYAEVSLKIRTGQIPVPIKLTEAAVSEFTETHPEYVSVGDELVEATRQYIKKKKELGYCDIVLKSLEHRKDHLTTFSSNYRAEANRTLQNIADSISKEDK